MSDSVISLSPSMKKRLSFDHPVMDLSEKMEPEQGEALIVRFLENKTKEVADQIIMGYLWVAKDLVSRFRAHWPQVIYMTDDLAGEAMTALSTFVWDLEEFTTEKKFFNTLQASTHNHLRDYINKNRSAFSASTRTNFNRQKAEQELEYNYAAEYSDDLNGETDYHPAFIDIMDEIEQLQDVDQERMRDLIYQCLSQDHQINEEELTQDEKDFIERLIKTGVSFQ